MEWYDRQIKMDASGFFEPEIGHTYQVVVTQDKGVVEKSYRDNSFEQMVLGIEAIDNTTKDRFKGDWNITIGKDLYIRSLAGQLLVLRELKTTLVGVPFTIKVDSFAGKRRKYIIIDVQEEIDKRLKENVK